MKARCLLILLSLLAACPTFTQNRPKPEWNVGLAGGLSFSSVSFQPTLVSQTLPTAYRMDVDAGITVRYIADRNVGIQGELNYSRLGWKQDFTQETGGYEHWHCLQYIEFPLLTHVYIGNKLRLILNFGPKIGYMIGEEEQMNQALIDALASGTLNSQLATAQYGKSTDNRFDYGIIGGLGVELRTVAGILSVEGRYAASLSDIYNNSKIDGDFTRSANRNIYIRGSYLVKF